MNSKRIRNIGILAHVDAGKTTLSEQLLYLGGALSTLGRVDRGNTLTDSLEVEKRHGITVRSTPAAVNWRGTDIHIIDTPGHADFYSDVECSARAIDGAVLVVSSVEGIQLQTRLIWEMLRDLRIPTLIFVNKLDRLGSRSEILVREMRKKLGSSMLPVQRVIDEGLKRPRICSYVDDPNSMEEAIEVLAHEDDRILQRYADDEPIVATDLDQSVQRLASQGKIHPVLFGAALSGIGVHELMDAIVRYLPAPTGDVDAQLAAVIFKIETGTNVGRAAHVRVLEGVLPVREPIRNATRGSVEKVTRIQRLSHANRYEVVDALDAGDVGILFGTDQCLSGDLLGSNYEVCSSTERTEPMLVSRLQPFDLEHRNSLLQALRRLEEEGLVSDVEWSEHQRVVYARFFGEVQMDVVGEMLSTRFGLEVEFSKPATVYKETPRKSAEASIRYRDGGYADLKLRVDPLPTGSGFQFESAISGDNKIYQKFMKQIPLILEDCRGVGVHGWEVTDAMVTLIDGYCKYDLGTKPDDFKIVTPMVFEKALRKAGTKLLEPTMDFEINVPKEYAGQIQRTLSKMGAYFRQTVVGEERLSFDGRMPLADALEYAPVLYSLSHGHGALKTKFCGYFPIDRLK